ncbi:hypothetical protein HY492_00385, partial [Candidatus Woesearchaeota archaeon]|nr:hypothetical protein [Candidatus Woesearchaeota archaeon]
HRTLKRGKDRIAQDAGWLLVDGLRKDGTAQELRAWVIELLGYPKEFLTKSKSLLFRYTVFTPQEEMKRILFEDAEGRLETLRNVFGVDKYKRVQTNAQLLGKQLKEDRRHLEGLTADLETKKILLQLKRDELGTVRKRLQQTADQSTDARRKLLECRNALSIAEEQAKEAIRVRTELTAAQQALHTQTQQLQRMAQEETRLLEQLRLLEQDVPVLTTPVEVIRQHVQEKNAALAQAEQALRTSHQTIAGMTATQRLSEAMKQQVSSLDHCPTCLQAVSLAHKNRITSAEDQKIKELQAHLAQHQAAKDQWDTHLLKTKQELETLRKQEQQALLGVAQQRARQDKQDALARMKETLEQSNNAQTAAQQRVAELAAMYEASKDVETRLLFAKQQFERANAELQSFELAYARTGKELEGVEQLAAMLDNEIAQKRQSKEKLDQLKRVHGWLTDHFSPLLDTMEQHVLAKVYHEFNELFQRWFAMLIEDELLTARLDQSFAPVILQNGYETDVTNLSGGEKTACALAYRLALNKVINDVISTIRTKDILILDEPTDGFSAEQLDKVRDVLDQLGLRQVILVSHETKIESMVDAVIRVQKAGHVSTAS